MSSPKPFEVSVEHKPPAISDEKENRVSRLERAQWLRAAILGANDGLLSTTSLMLGVGAAQESQWSMILSGVAGALAGACSMAVGEFVSVSTQRDIELSLSRRCKSKNDQPSEDKVEVMDIKLDITSSVQTKPSLVEYSSPAMKIVITDAREDRPKEEEGEKEVLPNPLKAGAASGSSFLFGAFFPLVPALFITESTTRFIVIVAVATLALIIFGVVGAYLGGSSLRASAIRVLLGGWVSMAITFGLLKSLDKVSDKLESHQD